ncbi:helix-turn-helix domain-containing protein [Tepidanaerobacter acetatoxydans]|uniref:helix-turn-helix domain-containing protein n=1 Tax=Tepidanaerobacter acetatoxydans TaxID=499229 RepID=UPI001BD4FA07|nr:helix-turn-helix transcriptional regulator [Tepidanaerobacter acetatoxydans]
MLKIKKARKKVGLTQLQLAKKVGINREYLSRIENNHSNPSLELLREIANALEVSVKDLIEDEIVSIPYR